MLRWDTLRSKSQWGLNVFFCFVWFGLLDLSRPSLYLIRCGLLFEGQDHNSSLNPWKNVCMFHIFRTDEPFATKISMLVRHYRPERYAQLGFFSMSRPQGRFKLLMFVTDVLWSVVHTVSGYIMCWSQLKELFCYAGDTCTWGHSGMTCNYRTICDSFFHDLQLCKRFI